MAIEFHQIFQSQTNQENNQYIEYASSIHKNQIDHNLRLMELVIDNKASKNIELLLICSCLHDTIRNTQDLYNIQKEMMNKK